MINYIRMTKITDVVGRADYISNPDRQENLVVQSDSIDWKPYREYERTARKGLCENNEAREIIIALPNEWDKLERIQLINRVKSIAEKAIGKSTDLQWAVHWNKSHTNLHAHILFSERQLISTDKNVKIYNRYIYLTADGKVARSKKDRAKDESGKDKPPVHRKGEKKGTVCEFSVKDVKYKSKNWLESVKTDLTAHFKALGIHIDENGHFHQYHEGKGTESSIIHQKNQRIKKINAFIAERKADGCIFPQKNTPEHKELCKKVTQHLTDGKPFNLNYKKPKNLNIPIPNPINQSTSSDNTVTAKPSPVEPVPFDPVALITARDNYVENYFRMCYKARNKIDTSVTDEAVKIERATVQFSEFAKKIQIYNEELEKCNIFQKSKKLELINKINNAATQFEYYGKIIEKARGAVNFYSGEALNYKNPQDWIFNHIVKDMENNVMPKVKTAVSAEIKKREILESLKYFKYEDVEITRARFIKLLKELPIEYKERAYNALQADYKKLSVFMHPTDFFELNKEFSKIYQDNDIKSIKKQKDLTQDYIPPTPTRGRGR